MAKKPISIEASERVKKKQYLYQNIFLKKEEREMGCRTKGKLFVKLIRGLFIIASLGVYFCLQNNFAFSEEENFLRFLPVVSSNHVVGPVEVSDINGDGNMEMFARDNRGKLFGLDSSGNDLPGFPVDLVALSGHPPILENTTFFVGTPLALGDLDGDGHKEIVVHVGFFLIAGGSQIRLFVLSSNGEVHPDWPLNGLVLPTEPDFGAIASSPIVSDLDLDGQPEIVISQYAIPQYALTLHVLKRDGTPFNSSFPMTFPTTNASVEYSTPATGDLDGDGDLEIVVIDDGKLHVIRHEDATELAGWPISVRAEVVDYSPVLGDIDNDGRLNVIVSGRTLSPASGTEVSVFNPDGTMLPGWPHAFEGYIDATNSPSLADLDGDQKLEVIYASAGNTAWVHVLRYDGTLFPGWPQETHLLAHPSTNVTVADLNGDNQNDLLYLTRAGKLYAWNQNGALFPDFPFQIPAPNSIYIITESTPVITDLKSDGDVDFVMTLNFQSNSSPYASIPAFLAIDWYSTYNPNSPWPSFHRNTQHTGLFNKYSLNIGIIGDGAVTQTPLADPLGRYQDGQEVQLYAIPNAAYGWLFGRWLRDLTGTTNPATLVTDRDKSVTARFRRLRLIEPAYIDSQ